jgi:DNA topoisomerase-1
MPPKKNPQTQNPSSFLLIVESPSKCKKIEEYLGSNYKCIATMGHFRTLKNLKSIQTKTNFEPMFEMDDGKKEYIMKLKPIIESYVPVNILLATDDDREGESIAWHICQVFHLPIDTPRILFHEITKKALEDAVSHPTTINMNLVYSQHSRQILDMMVGFKISPFLWKYLYNNKTKSLSAGRCQTPALKLVYENDTLNTKELEMKYKTNADFFDTIFTLNHDFTEETELVRFLEKSLTFKDYTLSVSPKKESVHKAPRPFNTSSMLQSVSSMLHYSPKQTMKLCQELYQNGYITYMRTENTKYSEQFIRQASQYIQLHFNEHYIGDITQIQETSKGTNPHEAIRVTNLDFVLDDKHEHLHKLYQFIRKNTIESCMAPAVYNGSLVEIGAPLDKKYHSTIEIPQFLGWKRYSISATTQTEIQERETSKLFYFNSLSPSATIAPTRIESLVGMQNKHHHYTEASLIKKLEDLGIGRPSTFASLVETIQDREYVKKQDIQGEKIKCNEFELTPTGIVKTVREKVFGNEKNKLVITPLGSLTIEFLISHFNALFCYDYTQQMECMLEETFMGDIEELENKRKKICKECYDEIQRLCKPLAGIEKKAYPIGDSGVELVFQKYGACLKRTNADSVVEFVSIKEGLKLDLKRLERGEYTLDELMETQDIVLGEYEGKEMKLKKGKYGPYVEWGESRESVKPIQKPFCDISLDDIKEMLSVEVPPTGDNPRSRPTISAIKTSNPNILKYINTNLSIRKNVKTGKPYIFYKTADMTKPQFYSLQKFQDSYKDCDVKILKEWILNTYIKKKT